MVQVQAQAAGQHAGSAGTQGLWPTWGQLVSACMAPTSSNTSACTPCGLSRQLAGQLAGLWLAGHAVHRLAWGAEQGLTRTDRSCLEAGSSMALKATALPVVLSTASSTCAQAAASGRQAGNA